MSDATSSPPRRSSLAAPATARRHSNSSSGDGDFETCLEQAAGFVVGRDSSKDSEGRSDNKQKRKRTSPADQAVLEAEYRQYPKPNKAARAVIVEKVSMNEKEVQIWFQNRRQIHRRKSRSLLPHEIAAYGLGGMALMSSDSDNALDYPGSQGTEKQEASSQAEVVASQKNDQSHKEEVEFVQAKPAERIAEPEKEVEAEVEVDASVEQVTASLPPQLPRQNSSGVSAAEPSSSSATNNAAKSFPSTPGYLANRRNAFNSSFSTPPSAQVPKISTPPPTFTTTQPTSCPERIDETIPASKSHIRLSLSLDGKAELISTTPSPPRRHAPRPNSSSALMIPHRRLTLHRSQSAITFGTRPRTSLVPRLLTGRSRDVRSWEKICCDAEVPDELTTQAENELSGSAVAAISLIRSSSNAALKANPNKRNAPSTKPDSSKQGKKLKLGGSMSSVARLEDSSMNPSKGFQDPPGFNKHSPMPSPAGDSDKENWLPHENRSNPRRRPLPSGRTDKRAKSRAVLGDNHSIPSHALDFGGTRSRERKQVAEHRIFEDQEDNAEVGAEVEKLMRSAVSPSKEGDLDCIQGLLSLSQGNWQ
ncbi:homeobox domain-containing protein [Diplocarpon rosae]|nr:homeobox domain-containing protein [Diplocarpon rosae]